jgi:hypothetical protein
VSDPNSRYLYEPPARPDEDLAGVTICLEQCREIRIVSADEGANGRIFKWLVDQIQQAWLSEALKRQKPPGEPGG